MTPIGAALRVTMSLAIERWGKPLGKSKYLVLSEGEFVPADQVETISGWYADYDEGRFAYWQEADRQFVSWQHTKVELQSSSLVKWESRIAGRCFKVICRGKIRLNFKYHTLLRRPWRLITDILLMDDDWGLVYDLPSFIDSGHASGNLVSMVEQWNDRGHS